MTAGGKLLIAVDFSPGSRKAFDAALRLALDLKAKIILVHALSKDVMPASAAVETMGFVDPRTRGLGVAGEASEAGVWADELRRAGLEVEVVVRAGKAAQVILEEAKRSKAAVIAVGSEGKTGLRRMFVGSVAEAVIQKSGVPVLVTPARMGSQAARGATKSGPLVIAVDFSSDSEAAFEAGIRLAKNLQAKVRLVHVVVIPPVMGASPDAGMMAYSPELLARDEEAAAEDLAQLASKAPGGAGAQPVLAVGHPASCIVGEAKAAEASLIVVGTHGRGGLRKLFLGSVAQTVVQLADRPVLVVPNALLPDTP